MTSMNEKNEDVQASADVSKQVLELALLAKEASSALALTSTDERNRALQAMADALRESASAIELANEVDMAKARERGTSEAILDRLMLNTARVNDMASALEDLISLEDPLGKIDFESTLYNGIELRRVRVPLGVVAVVYEARPNVTADAAGICLKSGNACVLRGGSLAARSNETIANVLARAVERAGLPKNSICAITTTDRSATDALMQLHGIIDVLVPRGGAGLIQHCVETSKVPVIETGTGNCHVYVNETASFEMARAIAVNAKCRRYGVCNAAETLLVDESIAAEFLPLVMRDFAEAGVLMHCDDVAFGIAEEFLGDCADGAGGEGEGGKAANGESTNGKATSDALKFERATETDWATEYLAPEIAIKCVSGVDAAIAHINKFGTKHSEAIVCESESAAEKFTRGVDAAAVYVNASTAFTDGGQFGLGAEIGISTQKLHARGPFALDALTSYKYVLYGEGQTRA